jgi:hypothetical protein
VAVATLAAAAGPAAAATEVATLAAGDGRLGILLSLFVPAIGWVVFNMAQVSEEGRREREGGRTGDAFVVQALPTQGMGLREGVTAHHPTPPI